MTLKNTIWYTNVCNEYIIRNKKAERSIHHPVSLIAVKIVKTPGNSYICGQFDSYGNVFLFIQNKISVYKRIVNCVTKNQPCVKRNRINVTKKVLIDDIYMFHQSHHSCKEPCTSLNSPPTNAVYYFSFKTSASFSRGMSLIYVI